MKYWDLIQNHIIGCNFTTSITFPFSTNFPVFSCQKDTVWFAVQTILKQVRYFGKSFCVVLRYRWRCKRVQVIFRYMHCETFCKILTKAFNPLNTNPTEWSNTLEQFVGCCRQIFWVWPFCGVGAERVTLVRPLLMKEKHPFHQFTDANISVVTLYVLLILNKNEWIFSN